MPDEQAEPEDTAIPFRSKAIMAVSAFSSGAVNSGFGRVMLVEDSKLTRLDNGEDRRRRDAPTNLL